jgi:hypothetical protein
MKNALLCAVVLLMVASFANLVLAQTTDKPVPQDVKKQTQEEAKPVKETKLQEKMQKDKEMQLKKVEEKDMPAQKDAKIEKGLKDADKAKSDAPEALHQKPPQPGKPMPEMKHKMKGDRKGKDLGKPVEVHEKSDAPKHAPQGIKAGQDAVPQELKNAPKKEKEEMKEAPKPEQPKPPDPKKE